MTGPTASSLDGAGAAATLEVRELRTYLYFEDRVVPAVDGISFSVNRGATLAIVGESGSGKTMTGLAVCGLQPPGSRVSGTATFDDGDGSPVDLLRLRPAAMNRLRGRRIAMVFQDPTTSLHPMLSIGAQLTDHVRRHLGLSRDRAREHAVELLDRVQVSNPREAIRRYPHQFSGGQLQRIAIAGAIACEPAVLIADEPTTALDVTVQAGVLRLLRELRDDLGLAIVLVTHDLGVMSAVADTISVMRAGQVLEHGSRYKVIREPRTDYARELVASLPRVPPPGVAS